MNANLPQKTLAISQWLREATGELKAIGIDSARLDAEIILAHTIRKSRTFLHAHPDSDLSPRHVEIADSRLQLRIDRTPIAYIVGHKEFYGRLFRVTPATLIPRPESETIITIIKEVASSHIDPLKITDVGTGSGCLGITAKLEIPNSTVYLTDISHHALKVAEANANHLGADVEIQRGNLLLDFTDPSIDIIIANLPYVSRSWERSPETNYEPAQALFADNNGLALIEKLIPQATSLLSTSGHLLLEADPKQHATIITIAKDNGFTVKEIRDFIIWLTKD